ncbi:MAG: hypothetical protein MHPSP_000862, partial [Paramarteilia canceri]
MVRKERIEQMRNSIQIFREYKDLFTLQSNLENLFNNHRYMDATFLYQSISKKHSDVNFSLGKDALNNCKELMNQYSSEIQGKLSHFSYSYDEQKEMLQFIIEIENNSDQLIKSIQTFKSFIQHEIIEIFEKYVTIDNEYEFTSQRIPEFSVFKKYLLSDTKNITDSDFYNQELLKYGQPPNIAMVNALLNNLMESLPKFWKVWKFVLSYLETTDMNNKRTSVLEQYFDSLIELASSVIVSVIDPQDENSKILISNHTDKWWSHRFDKRSQFWLPFIIPKLVELGTSLKQIDISTGKYINQLILDAKAMCAIKFAIISSHIVKNFSLICNIYKLKLDDGQLIKSVIVDLFESVVINLSKLLESSFSTSDSKQN